MAMKWKILIDGDIGKTVNDLSKPYFKLNMLGKSPYI